MSTKRLTMRKIKEVLRLRFDLQRTLEQIAKSCNIGRTTASDYLNRFKGSGLSWPLPSDMEDTQLELRLFPSARVVPDSERQIATQPDYKTAGTLSPCADWVFHARSPR